MKHNGVDGALGRPPKEDRGDIVRNNGFSEKQWEWLQKEAASKGMDTMTYVRKYPIQWWIDSLEASRAGSIATSAEDYEQFSELINKKSNHKYKSKKE